MNATLSARRLAAVLSVVLLFSGAACSASGDESGDAPPTTASAGDPTTTDPGEDDDPTTTVGGDDETTTTTEGGSGGDGDLEALLPDLSSLPDGYEEVAFEDSDADDFGPELDDACPDADVIRDFADSGSSNDGETVGRSFETEFQQVIEVKIRPSNDREVPFPDLIDAYNGCDPIETESGGNPTTLDFFSEEIDLTDEGLHLQMDAVLDASGTTIEFTFHGFTFRRDGIAVQVTAESGINEDDYSPVAAHPDEAYEIAADIYDAIGER